MFDWLFEGHLAVYLVLAAAALLCLLVWWSQARAPSGAGDAGARRREDDALLADYAERFRAARGGAKEQPRPTAPRPADRPRRPERWWLVAGLIAAGLAGLYFLLDVLVETDVEADRKQIRQRLQALSDAVKNGDGKAVLDNLSDKFRSPGGKNKELFRSDVLRYLTRGGVEEIEISGLEFEGRPSRQDGAKVQFQARGRGGALGPWDGRPVQVEATFDYDTQHGWRLAGYKAYFPGGLPVENLP
jgi:hypothetical protein